MSAFTLLSGTLFRRPELKTSAGGRQYLRCTVRDGAGDETSWWSITAFDDAVIASIAALDRGSPIAIAGPMSAEIYAGERGARVSLSLIALQVISLRKRRRQAAAAVPAAEPFDDEVPL
jgi:hypothetical protein